MINHEFARLLKDLRVQASKSVLRGVMQGFDDGASVACPWLEWHAKNWPPAGVRPSGLFLMQDWGTADQDKSLATALNLVSDWMKMDPEATITDKTAKQLLRHDRQWRTAFADSKWLVSNAVWGIRTNPKKCGTLTDRAHKMAFPVWLQLIRRLVVDLDPGVQFHLVVAGSWARFDGDRSSDGTLQQYLQRWITWVANSRQKDLRDLITNELESHVSRCTGKVHFVPHPCTWSNNDLQNGPPLA